MAILNCATSRKHTHVVEMRSRKIYGTAAAAMIRKGFATGPQPKKKWMTPGPNAKLFFQQMTNFFRRKPTSCYFPRGKEIPYMRWSPSLKSVKKFQKWVVYRPVKSKSGLFDL